MFVNINYGGYEVLFTFFHLFISYFINCVCGESYFARPKRSTYEQTYQNQQTTYNQTNQSSDPNVIDVDYKVVDEEDNDTH